MNTQEVFRPGWHFTPRRNWMNDPNGLVYLDGEYHLFFQYNPTGCEWGEIGWGHAVSTDLLTWEELPMALPAQDNFMIFSGSAIVDHASASGVGSGTATPLLAFYTAHYPAHGGSDPRQCQHLAYSEDRGRTWLDHPANPILDLGLADFRDPKVFWHPPTEAWIMVVAFAADRQIGIFTSLDLVEWCEQSRFGPVGFVDGQWECPDLFELPVAGTSETHWILKVDVDRNVIGAGSGSQCFVGRFDGQSFEATNEGLPQLVDNGPDFYAAQTFSDLPTGSYHPIWLAWCANHQLATQYPTPGWQGCQTLPREVFLFEDEGSLRLGQRPVAQWDDVLEPVLSLTEQPVSADQQHVIAELPADGGWDVRFACTQGENGYLNITTAEGRISVGFEADGYRAFVDLGKAGLVVSEAIDRRYCTHRLSRRQRFDIRLIWDATTLEIFVNGGEAVLTGRVFLTGIATLSLNGGEQPIRFTDIAIYRPRHQ